jgi:hypothetical protein
VGWDIKKRFLVFGFRFSVFGRPPQKSGNTGPHRSRREKLFAVAGRHIFFGEVSYHYQIITGKFIIVEGFKNSQSLDAAKANAACGYRKSPSPCPLPQIGGEGKKARNSPKIVTISMSAGCNC